MSSTAEGGRLLRSRSGLRSPADRSSARTSRKMPFSAWARPMGVRTASMSTAWRMAGSLSLVEVTPSLYTRPGREERLGGPLVQRERQGPRPADHDDFRHLLFVERKRRQVAGQPLADDAEDNERVVGHRRGHVKERHL